MFLERLSRRGLDAQQETTEKIPQRQDRRGDYEADVPQALRRNNDDTAMTAVRIFIS